MTEAISSQTFLVSGLLRYIEVYRLRLSLGPVLPLDGEAGMKEFKSDVYRCASKIGILTKDVRICLTDKRISITEKFSLGFLNFTKSTEVFRYSDIQNMLVEHNYRIPSFTISGLIFLATVVLIWIGLAEHRVSIQLFGFASIFFAIMHLIKSLSTFSWNEQLKLDFYRKETITTWIILGNKKFEARGGSSVTKLLPLNLKDRRSVVERIINHEDTLFVSRNHSGEEFVSLSDDFMHPRPSEQETPQETKPPDYWIS